MATKATPQTALDERQLDDKALEKALEDRETAKGVKGEATAKFNTLDEVVKDKLEEFELGELELLELVLHDLIERVELGGRLALDALRGLAVLERLLERLVVKLSFVQRGLRGCLSCHWFLLGCVLRAVGAPRRAAWTPATVRGTGGRRVRGSARAGRPRRSRGSSRGCRTSRGSGPRGRPARRGRCRDRPGRRRP